MRKKDLYEFIEIKIKGQRRKAIKEAEEGIHARVEPLFLYLFDGMEVVEATAAQLAKDYENILDAFGMASDYNETEIIRDINNLVIGWSKRHRNLIRNRVTNAVLYPHHNDTYKKMLELKRYGQTFIDLPEVLIQEYAGRRQMIADFDKLATELDFVISNAPSAKQAYKTLIDLGVDMTGFDGEENLPAVVKLSVDPCLINGGCK